MITADEAHSNNIYLPNHHTIPFNNNREASALFHKIRNQDLGLRTMPEYTERGRVRTGQA